MGRVILHLLIGGVLAVLLGAAAQALFIPFFRSDNAATLGPLAQVVFWIVFVATMLIVVRAIRQGRRESKP